MYPAVVKKGSLIYENEQVKDQAGGCTEFANGDDYRTLLKKKEVGIMSLPLGARGGSTPSIGTLTSCYRGKKRRLPRLLITKKL